MQMLYDEAGANVFDKMAEKDDNLQDEWGGENNTVQACIEFGVYPPTGTAYNDVMDWLGDMPFYLEDAGLTFPTAEMLQGSMLDYFGGYASESPPEGYPK